MPDADELPPATELDLLTALVEDVEAIRRYMTVWYALTIIALVFAGLLYASVVLNVFDG